MNQPAETTLAAATQSPAGEASPGDINVVRKQMFLDFCAALESAGIAYVILSGYQGYPDRIDSDIDFMVSETDFKRLPAFFNTLRTSIGLQMVQIVQYDTTACAFVLTKQTGRHTANLQLDFAFITHGKFSLHTKGRPWLFWEKVIASRRLIPAGFWIPASYIEFEYYLVKRVDKGLVELRHLDQLAALQAEDPAGCRAVLTRLAPEPMRDALGSAIATRDVTWFAQHCSQMQRMLGGSLPRENFSARLRSRVDEWLRLMRRILQPTGLVIAVLGPDGSGKTTVIEHLERELAPAFRRVTRYHLRPHFGQASGGVAVTDPHGQKPRGYLASAAKVCLFVLDYWIGWLRWVYPAKVRSSLVVFDRYYHDMLVDPARYRLPRGSFLPRWFAPLVPRPDIWLVLHAQPELLVARKGEITLETARTLSLAYEHLALRLGANLIDTGRGLDETLTEAVKLPLDHLAARTRRRIGTAQ